MQPWVGPRDVSLRQAPGNMGALPRKRALELACSVGCDSEPRGHLHSVSTFEAIDVIKKATEHLAAADPRLAGLIAAFGPPERLIAKDTCCFRSLAKSILYQQLAGTAAAAIYSRFLAVCKVNRLLPLHRICHLPGWPYHWRTAFIYLNLSSDSLSIHLGTTWVSALTKVQSLDNCCIRLFLCCQVLTSSCCCDCRAGT